MSLHSPAPPTKATPKRGLAVGLTLLLAVAGYLLVARFLAPDQWVFRSELERSDDLIAAVEDFRSEHGRLPTNEEVLRLGNAAGLGLTEQCPCYKLRDEGTYLIWFGGETLGSSLVYDSRTGTWSKSH